MIGLCVSGMPFPPKGSSDETPGLASAASSGSKDRLNESFDASALDGVLCDASFNHDIHASAEYRQHLCTVMAKRAVTEING